MSKWICFWTDDSGGSATEYALTLTIIGGCVAVMAIGLGHAIGFALNSMTECIERHDGTCFPQTAGVEPVPAAVAPTPGATDPTPANGKPGKGKPPKPPKGCPSWAHCKR